MAGITEERFITKRVTRLVYLGVISVLTGVLMGLLHRLAFGHVLVLLIVDVLFAVLFTFYLENGRLHNGEEPDSAEYYQRLAIYFTAAAVFAVAASFFPAYTSPVLLIAFFLTAGLDREQAVILTVFFDVQIAMGSGTMAYELVCYLLLSVSGVLLTSMHQDKDYRKYSEPMALALNMAVPVMLCYMGNGKADPLTFGLAFACGAVCVLGMHFLYDKLSYRRLHEGELSLDAIVDANYHLVKELKNYSKAEYNHALRVSRISGHCAALVDADVRAAAVGGFYYRLGRLMGEPYVENGVKIAQNNCFPSEVVQILREYNGQEYPISTIESAIVHITDAVVTKFELLDHNTLSSSWNRDIVIYQTLNEKSSSGIYDNSGLTMNRFIKIRDFLAKEEELL